MEGCLQGLYRWRKCLAAVIAASTIVACGGDNAGTGTARVNQNSTFALEVGAPALTNNVALDGLNWINFRRAQAGLPVVARNGIIDRVAQGHAEYQKINNIVSHEQTASKTGFTGATLQERFVTSGYALADQDYVLGEVISATSSSSGVVMAEELITAIYHRFVIFEPMFKEIGTGSVTTNAGYTYFTSNFAALNGYGPGVGNGMVVGWPANGQTNVPTNFFSDYEVPDPVASANEVGYPVSVHADINATLNVSSFTIRPRGGNVLATKLLSASTDAKTPGSAAALVPLSVLKAGTLYDVTFSGTAGASSVVKNWSFTTR